jgi:hypothetical protein
VSPTPDSPDWSPQIGVVAALVVALAGAAAVFGPIVHVYFHEDDLFLLYQFANDPLLVTLFRPYLGHVNFVRNVVCGVTLGSFGPDAETFQMTVLIGHLVATGVLFGLILRVTRSALVACFGALLWGTCPTNIGTLGWYAAFGHTLCTIFSLLAFRVVVLARETPEGLTPRRIAELALLLAAAATSFGAGLGLALAFPAVVWLLAPPNAPTRSAWIATLAIPVAVAAVYLGLRLLFAALGGREDETPIRLVLENIDPAYAANLLAQFVGFGTASLVAGAFVASLPWPTPSATIASAGVGVLVSWAVWTGTPRSRRVVLAALVMAVAAYGSVVAGRSAFMMLIRVLPESGAVEPRYHYAAQAWLALAISTSLSILLGRLAPVPARALVSAGIAVVLVAHAVRTHPYEYYSHVRGAVTRTLDQIRAAAEASPPGGVVRVPNRYFPAAAFLADRPEVLPGIAGIFVIFHPADDVDGRRIVFESPRFHVAEAQRRGGRIAELLVPPPDDRPDPTFGPNP